MKVIEPPSTLLRCSGFRNRWETEPERVVVVQKVLDAIESGRCKWKALVLEARRCLSRGDKVAYMEIKNNLPALTLSVCCKTRRGNASVSERKPVHSGLIQGDIDAAGNPAMTLKRIKGITNRCPHTFASFVSPSGEGLKVLLRCPPDLARHTESFFAAERWFKDRGITIDAATKSLYALLYVSYDPHLYRNYAATEIKPINAISRKATPEQITLKMEPPSGLIRRLLEQIACDDPVPEYHKWISICFATFDGVGKEEGIELLSEIFPEKEPERYEELADSFDSKRTAWQSLQHHLSQGTIETGHPTQSTNDSATGRTLPEGRRAPLTIRSIDEILAMPDSPADLILANGYIERGERTAICGMGGVGKSRLIMHLAMMHRAGRPFLAWETRSPELKWLFLQTENGTRRLKKDLTAMLTGFTPREQAVIKAGIFIHTLEGEDDGNLLLTDPANQERAIQAILESGAAIVVWDPLRDFTGDDLNKDVAMSEALRIIRSVTRLGDPQRTCIIIHHAGEGKAGIVKATGYDRGAFGRNSKVLKGWARAQINVAPATPDNNAQIVIASGKCNNFEEFSPISARLNPRTLLYELVPDFDFGAWQESLTGTREKATTVNVVEILGEAGGSMDKNDAIAMLQAKGVGRDAARNLIKKAVDDGQVEETTRRRAGKKSAVLLSLKD